MPKSTFLNLAEEKKQRIIEAAIKEFVAYTFRDASINRIIADVGIAKGSFYQYFENKKDLYKYVLAVSATLKLKYLTSQMIEAKHQDFFQILRGLYLVGVNFAKEHPDLSKMGNDILNDGDSKFKAEVLGESIDMSNVFIENLLKKGIEEGDVNPNIDVRLIAHLITTFSISLNEYYLTQCKEDLDVMTLIEALLAFIENGIRIKRSDF
ncbi:TetR/AcrR family transcriptional regulator [Fusibacter sp. 3D3]|uniref:TetR/AcrR family transcriptional regulator n=1 Tax=Fusibacter sp. 3D3 TaxID=1048380 RepID=UPI0008538231|nr:TetR/AcrR family transcriptional regulator [Fusibacter sp. 3D3]GAU79298.1 transcriptional regulator [Fusibacter sp. 3D3]